MEKIKKNLAVKITAFLLLQIMVMLTVLSAAVIAINVGCGWYSHGKKEAEKQLYYEVAYAAFGEITENFLHDSDGGLRLDTDEGLLLDDEQSQYEFVRDMELIEGENEATGFGYQFPITNGTMHAVKQLHADIKNNPAAYCYDFVSGDAVVEIYLVDCDKEGALPPKLAFIAALGSSVYQYRNAALGTGFVGLLGTIALLVFLIAAVGHSGKEQALPLQRVPLDFLAMLACVPVMVLGALFLGTLGGYNGYNGVSIICAALEFLGMSIVITGFILVFALDVKKGTWWKNTIIYHLLILGKHACVKLARFLWRVFGYVPLVWRTALLLAAVWLLNLFICYNLYWNGGGFVLWILEAVAISAGVIYVALLLKRLKEGGKHLAEGNLSYQIDKKGMWFDFAEHADNLNSIGKGMSKAVKERMKSEHFKAELITNVSHDIKTPLTSIINYVDFLKKEEIDNEKAQEYIEVLDRQSRRLKKLTEDLVDASKAATGNIQMHMAPCQIGVLMEQTMGEYKEKAEKNDLKFIMKMPGEELEIMADGKRLWRVFDNLLGNICKYSQPGTRVYLDLKEADGQAVIMYRNTSKYELNITEEELMERFVRGDSSRHTEGSGLGLSIARNLVELQGGSFQIAIDGDLFKVTIKFDLLN